MSQFAAPQGAGVFVTPRAESVDFDYFTPNDAIFPTLVAAAGTIVRNDHPLLTFDDGIIEAVDFAGVLYAQWKGSTTKVHLYWCAATAIVGDVVWGVAIERENDGGPYDVAVDSFGVEATATTAAQAVNGQLAKTSLTVSNNGATPGDPYRLRVRRLATDGADTMIGDAQLQRIVIEKA